MSHGIIAASAVAAGGHPVKGGGSFQRDWNG